MSSKTSEEQGAKRRGRPPKAGQAQVLEAAMTVFWAEGYEASSVDTLCRATGLPRASLYKKYDGKEGLFLAALQHYVETRIAPMLAALDQGGSLTSDLAAFFEKVVALATGQHGPNGCLISCVLSDAAGTNPRFKTELETRFSALETRLADRIAAEAAADSGAIAPRVQGMLLAAVARGIMVRARAGTPASQLAPVAHAAVQVCAPQPGV
ncbi:TetR/AcrR family transcriptional regulator [Lutimaribacter sp. EGI FJ00015]|uniref:TetR/AcrR family transcriptional regulator n=1 Tax=Lutimaribacter degradans TaxID=2945989 RepID=A0ACC5ZX62_9RHOB|nr:TetR/AcrR family transcriptional regulator [Lutimaribacter sp. EGI FJ00013]MCM2562647.1 TetR/AcrR family transcriptional regulator [Lutimaribacter sp. EGI FJ00013]MCO0613804.1 TetR/AcrR family transcriptional regulator [Lutimaribacter sp. EGI FJ00015]MCO0636713.1 TetR/AcrR family transcriptional regulator [Lutimaribacter sp. EGI FJ00014]